MNRTIAMIIACEAFRNELACFKDIIDVDILWIEHSLHNVPLKLNQKIREKLAEAEQILPAGSTVLLFFGNCGGALENLQTEGLNLVHPDVQDCIPIIVGSVAGFSQMHKSRPGTFYLNKAWIDSGEDPLGMIRKYTEHYGAKKGVKVAQKMLANYTHFALIDNGCYELQVYREHVKKACAVFAKEYAEEKGSLDLVHEILTHKIPLKEIPGRMSEVRREE